MDRLKFNYHVTNELWTTSFFPPIYNVSQIKIASKVKNFYILIVFFCIYGSTKSSFLFQSEWPYETIASLHDATHYATNISQKTPQHFFVWVNNFFWFSFPWRYIKSLWFLCTLFTFFLTVKISIVVCNSLWSRCNFRSWYDLGNLIIKGDELEIGEKVLDTLFYKLISSYII